MGDKGDISVELIVRPKTPTILLQTQGGPVGDKWGASVEPCSSEHPQHTGRQVGGNCRIMGPKALVVRVIPAQGTYSTLETSGR